MTNEAQNTDSKTTAEKQLKELDETLERKKEALRPTFWNYVFWNPFTQPFWRKFPRERSKLYLILILVMIAAIIFLIFGY